MVNAFALSTRVFIDRALSPKVQSEYLANFAKTDVAKLIASGRASEQYDRYVDGNEGAPEEAVKPNGIIAYIFGGTGKVVVYALGFLIGRSPHLTGRYQDSFVVNVGGDHIPAAEFDPELVPINTDVIIYNKQPYSRKIDVQLVGQKRLHFSTAPNLFADAQQAVRSRFGNSVMAKRLYNVDFPGKYALRQRQMRPKPRQHLIRRGVGELVESPGLLITARQV